MKKSIRLYKNRRSGFTLIEILLVVVIIGMLATVVVPRIAKSLGKGERTKAIADVRGIATQVEAYRMMEGKYPSSLSALTEGSDPYLSGIPKDPWDRDYQYSASSGRRGLRFEVYSLGEDGTQSGDDIGNWAEE